MSKQSSVSPWTAKDPFTDGAILEEQPNGYEVGTGHQDSGFSNFHNSSGDFEGTGVLVPWAPGHNRRRSSQVHSSYASSNSDNPTLSSRLSNRSQSSLQSSSLTSQRPSATSIRRSRQQLLLSKEHIFQLHSRQQSGFSNQPNSETVSSPINESLPTRPPRAFPLACPPKSHAATVDDLDEKSHSRDSSKNFSRPFNFPIDKVGMENSSPARDEDSAASWKTHGSSTTESSEVKVETEKFDMNKYIPDPNIPASRQRSSCVMQNVRKSKYTIEEEKVVRAVGKKRLRYTRNIFIVFFIIVNAVCITISWTYPEYWYICKLSLDASAHQKTNQIWQLCLLFFLAT